MASVEVAKLQKHEVQELGAVYAALLLSDAGVALDEKKLESVAKSAGVTVDATYAKFFVRALKGKKVETFFAVGGGAGGAAPAKGGDAKKEAPKEDKKDAKKETKKEPVKEEPKDDDVDMGGGLGLFDEF